MNIALLLKSELRRSAGILAGMALIIALALSIAVAAGICERMVRLPLHSLPTISIC